MTDRIVRTEKPKRGFFGQLFKWAFILFNVVMAWVFFSGLASAWHDYNRAGSETARGEAVFAIVLSASVLLVLWGGGALILGLVARATRGR